MRLASTATIALIALGLAAPATWGTEPPKVSHSKSACVPAEGNVKVSADIKSSSPITQARVYFHSADKKTGDYYLEFVTGPAIDIGRNAQAELTVRYMSPKDEPMDGSVWFDIEGDARGSTLDSAGGSTNDDGEATVHVRGGPNAADFRVVASADYADPITFRVDVEEGAGKGSLRVSLTYEGIRRLHVRADGEPVGIRIESLAIPLFSSTSSKIGFEADFTKVVRREFISNARVPLVPEEKAQMVLIGKIQDIQEDPLTYRSQGFMVGGHTKTYQVTSSRTLRLRLDVQLVDKRLGKVIWHQAGMQGQGTYSVSGDPLETRYNEQQALERIANDLAKIIYSKTMERW